ncbi:MAG: four helix bundle protein [Balneola sp.]
MSDKKEIVRTFEDLKVWQIAHKISIDVFELTKRFPPDEKYRLKDQIIRSSRSISDNIAEGYGRFHYQENTQYCRQSRGSAYELINQLITAFDCKYINEEELSNKKLLVSECIKLLNGYIRYLQKAKNDNTIREDEIFYNPKVDKETE